MKTLILKKTAAAMGGKWSDNDYVVLEGGKVIGRIMLHPQDSRGFGRSHRLRIRPQFTIAATQ
jgi:hypothetical protein